MRGKAILGITLILTLALIAVGFLTGGTGDAEAPFTGCGPGDISPCQEDSDSQDDEEAPEEEMEDADEADPVDDDSDEADDPADEEDIEVDTEEDPEAEEVLQVEVVEVPLTGEEAMQDSRTPAVVDEDVRSKGVFTSWTDLVERVEVHGLEYYKEEFRVNSNYRYDWEDVLQWAEWEQEHGIDARVIYANYVGDISDDEIRELAATGGVEDVEDLLIIRIDGETWGFENTRHLNRDRFDTFRDFRSQVRVGLVGIIEVDDDDESKFTYMLDWREGSLVDCGNRFRLYKPDPTPKPPTTNPPTTNPPPVTPPPTTEPPVTTPPTTAPPTTAPPTTAPPTTTPPTTTIPDCNKDRSCSPPVPTTPTVTTTTAPAGTTTTTTLPASDSGTGGTNTVPSTAVPTTSEPPGTDDDGTTPADGTVDGGSY